MAALTACYIHATSTVTRQIAGHVVLVPIRDDIEDLESIYHLNETSAFAWHLLDGTRSLAQVRDALVATFVVTPEVAEADLLEFAAQLESIEAIRPAQA